MLLPHLPKQVKQFCDEEYPDIKDIKGNITLINNEVFELISHFTIPKLSWINSFYSPMEKRIKELEKKYYNNKIVLQTFEECKKEINMYNKYSDYYVYEFFIMQKK